MLTLKIVFHKSWIKWFKSFSNVESLMCNFVRVIINKFSNILVLLIPKCTRHRMITYTNSQIQSHGHRFFTLRVPQYKNSELNTSLPLCEDSLSWQLVLLLFSPSNEFSSTTLISSLTRRSISCIRWKENKKYTVKLSRFILDSSVSSKLFLLGVQ